MESPSNKAVKREEGGGRTRQFSGAMKRTVIAVSVAFCVFCLLYVSGALSYMGVYLLGNQYNAIFLTGVLVVIFLIYPARKLDRNRLPWYDVVLIIAAIVGCTYISVNAIELAYMSKMFASPVEIVLGVITIITLAEGVRRTMGWAMVIIGAVFLLYARFGSLLPGVLHIYPYEWSQVFADFYLSGQGIFGTLLAVASEIMVPFIAFGVFFVAVGGGKTFVDVALAIAGTTRGGPAKAAVLGSALFGTISGSATANVATVGVITIPMMKKTGYEPHYAAAIETIASTGGTIMPPIMAGISFVMASMLGVPYSKIAIMAAIPAVLYFLSLFIQADLQAGKRGLHGVPRSSLPSIKAIMQQGWELIIPFLILIVFLFVFRATAALSAIYGIISIIVISYFRKERRFNLNRFLDSLAKGFQGVIGIAAIIALAGVILSSLTVSGLGPRISSALVTFFGSNALFLLIAAALVCYFLGMGVSSIASYIVVSSLVVPALYKLGVPTFVAHFFIMYMVTSTYFTPPYAPATFVAAAIGEAAPFRTGFQAMRLGIVCYLVPFVIIYNPALLLIGTPLEIAIAIPIAIIGVIVLSFGIEGYLLRQANWAQRILLLASGFAIIAPGGVAKIIGAIILALVIMWQWQAVRKERTKTTIV